MLPIESKVKSCKSSDVNSVAKQYDQPRETGGGRECSLAMLCGVQMSERGTCAEAMSGTRLEQVKPEEREDWFINSQTRPLHARREMLASPVTNDYLLRQTAIRLPY